jgi:putative spermidine/putrescine transport system ATP-binding protein
LKRLQNRLGITFIHVTHTQPEAIALADLVVVMNQGIIEQAASAHDVYARPRSPYVARFMGGQNVLSGTVAGADGATLLLNGPKGERFRIPAPAAPPPAGAPFHFSVRRDLIQSRRSETSDIPENAVRGRVEAVEYQGTFVKVTLSGATAEEFIVNEPDAVFFANRVSPGDPVIAHWDVAHVHLLEADRAAGSAAQPYAEAAL